MRVLLTLAYDGSAYHGWQQQRGVDTVQARVQDALHVLTGRELHVEGAGRTDAGVHALGQRAHVDLPRPFDPLRLRLALNGNLPRDIAVREVLPVPESVHARFSATGKRYGYRFLCGPVRPVLGRGLWHWERRHLDLLAMRAAAGVLVGEHDFAAFASNPGYPRTRGTVRRLRHLHVLRRRHGVDVVVQGDGFLYNMVRTIAGTLRDVGVGRLTPQDVGAILRGRRRSAAGATLAAGGLCLLSVQYPRGLVAGS